MTFLPPEATCLVSVFDHGQNDTNCDLLFKTSKHTTFGSHGYPWLMHRLTYRRANRKLHALGYKEKGTITTPSISEYRTNSTDFIRSKMSSNGFRIWGQGNESHADDTRQAHGA